jgi:hypothetical protein
VEEIGAEGRQGKYHLDYFGIAGSAYCLLFGKYIEVSTVRNKWVVKDNFKRWWQVKVRIQESFQIVPQLSPSL